MEVVEERYNRFRAFVKESLPLNKRDNILIKMLDSTPLFVFLRMDEFSKEIDEEKAFNDMLKMIGLEASEIDIDHKNRLFLYMQYFKEVSQGTPN